MPITWFFARFLYAHVEVNKVDANSAPTTLTLFQKMSDTSANHPPAVVKPKRGRKPKNKPRTEEENNALAKLMSDLEAMKGMNVSQNELAYLSPNLVSQAARDVENARLNAELVTLRAYRSTVLSETRIGQQTISPTPVGGTSC